MNEMSIQEKEIMTNSGANAIQNVALEHQGGKLVAIVQLEVPQLGQFAYSVFRNGEPIHVQGYSANPTFSVDITAEPGLYRVLAQFRDSNGNTIKKYSKPV